MQGRIQNLLGDVNPKEGRQPILWTNLFKHCMETKKKIGPVVVPPKFYYVDPPLALIPEHETATNDNFESESKR